MNETFNADMAALLGRVGKLEKKLRDDATRDKPGNFTPGAVLFGSAAGKITQDAANLFWDDTNNRLGIGTNAPTVRFHLHGTNASYTGGPHVETTTASDAYPLAQLLSFQHDNIGLSFDAYFDGTNWKSSDAGSNFQLYKFNDVLKLTYNGGTAAGSNITWADAMTLNTAGNFTFNGVITNTVDGGFVASLTDAGTTNLVTSFIGRHLSSGTPGVGFGVAETFQSHSSNNTLRTQTQIYHDWLVATDASRQGRMRLVVHDSVGARVFLSASANGTGIVMGFFGSAGTTKPTITGSRGGNAALASLLTAGANLGMWTDSTTA